MSGLVKPLLCGLLLIATAPYALPPVHRFPEPHPFAGHALFNPYAHTRGSWRMSNLHSHGPAWGGIPDGRQSDAEVAAAYGARGYAVAGIADHQRLSATDTPGLSMYEHGYNAGKRHQLVVGARGVDWFDVPLWQGIDQKQYVLDRLRQSSALVAIAHPGERGAYTPEDFAHLSGYDLLEIVNGPDRYTALWDAALSSGHPVWGLADDDSHDVTDADHTMVAWTMIDAPTTRAGDIIAALRDGRSYAVSGTAAATEATVDRVTLVGTRLIVECSGAPTDYTFIGQDGRVLRTAGAGPSAAYDIAATDPYVRAEIGTAHGRIYLNPVVRYDGAGPASPRAVVDPARSWFHRAVWGGGCLLLVGAILTGRGAFTA